MFGVGGLLSAGENENPDCEETENTGEYCESQSSKRVRTPGVTVPELVEAVQSPCSVKNQYLSKLELVQKAADRDM